jgi:hypothetical protein
MKITNKYNMPDVLVCAVEQYNAKYSRGDAKYSATDLIRPPQITILQRRYSDKISEDVMDNIYRLRGRALHEALQTADMENAFTEERFSVEVEI